MMERILTLRCYNLVNAEGRKLLMYLGRYESCERGDYPNGLECPNDKGFRWMFEGSEIPMPVRHGTWFNGFPEKVMLDWLKGNGWALHATVNMATGKTTVYELPKANEMLAPKLTAAQEAHNDAISPAVQRYMARIEEAKNNGRTNCYISNGSGKPPVEAIQTLLDAGYDICYHSYGKGYGDWFVLVYWQRSCEKGKIFVGNSSGAEAEVTIEDYKNA